MQKHREQHTAYINGFDLHLQALNTTNPGDPNDLILQTVSDLALRAYPPAVALLREYLTYGEFWQDAFAVLAVVPGVPFPIDELSHMIDRRFPDDQILDACAKTFQSGTRQASLVRQSVQAG